MLGPTPEDPAQREANTKLLTERLNQSAAFDVQLNPQPKDRLLLRFQAQEGTYDYGFEFKNERWQAIAYDPFSWETNHSRARKGCVN